jgi:phosphatidylglycerophosphate synthase
MDIEQMALMIPILGIVLGVGIAIVAIIAAHREKQKRVELRHRERLAAIEKGIELAPDPEPDAGVKKTSSLKSGLSGVFIGVLLYFALYRVVNEDVALFGLIPAALGIATLISYFVENLKKP